MTKYKKFNLKGKKFNFKIGNCEELVFILGPCAIESEYHALKMCEKIITITQKLNINFVYKSCYDKDCRSSINSFHGVGLDEGLKILQKVKDYFNVPVTSDFSIPSEASQIKEVLDIVQIPAYLCRQTSILKAAASTNRPINIKKGQFMSPWNMKNSISKLNSFGSKNIILTERGTFFGYNMLVNDMRSLPIMSETGYPVCYDGTHSIQMPTSQGQISGGQREYIPYLVRAAASCGVDAIFLEVHDKPDKALSDKNTVLNLKHLERIISEAKFIHNFTLPIRKKRYKVD